jgi:hypothetical protein
MAVQETGGSSTVSRPSAIDTLSFGPTATRSGSARVLAA